ncbi:MAG: GDSL-type esterase/lipase family protein [Eubacteriales bacterium]|nr:GDSL-type esterase/lipase family protein [Eubacteriales bacterium]
MNLKGRSSGEEKVEIRLNRKMRTWNKYKNYIIVGGGILVLVLLMVFILRGCSADNDSEQGEITTPVQTTQPMPQQEQTTVQQEQTTVPQTTTAVQQTGTSLKISGTAKQEDYVGKDKLTGVTFVGDAIISGFSYYGYIDEANVITDGSMTSDRAADYIGQIAASNPSKVVLMVGLNDLNYGTRGTDTIADYIADFVSQVKSSVPSAKIYVLSVLPVTAGFESGGSVSITQSGIDELNGKLSDRAAQKNYTFIDAAAAYKDGTGYMNTSYTGNGSNIYNEYYPFLLNGIAGVMQ